MAAMSPEEREAFVAERNRKNRERYNARMARERAAGIRPPAVKGRPRPTKAQIEAQQREQAEERGRELNRKRMRNREIEARRKGIKLDVDQEIEEFIAEGAQEFGFSAFLKSQAHQRARRLNGEKFA